MPLQRELLVVLTQIVREFGYWLASFSFSCGNKRLAIPRPQAHIPPLRKKRVCFVRHGQGEHNVSPRFWGLVDSPLNQNGRQQAHALHEAMESSLQEFDLVVTSPLTRAIQTMQLGFKGCPARVAVLPLLRERLGAPCDVGRTRSELAQIFPELRGWEGFTEMPEIWWSQVCAPGTSSLARLCCRCGPATGHGR